MASGSVSVSVVVVAADDEVVEGGLYGIVRFSGGTFDDVRHVFPAPPPPAPAPTTSFPTSPPRLFPLSSRILPRSSCISLCLSDTLSSSLLRYQTTAPWCAAMMEERWVGDRLVSGDEDDDVSAWRDGRKWEIRDEVVVVVVGALDCRTT